MEIDGMNENGSILNAFLLYIELKIYSSIKEIYYLCPFKIRKIISKIFLQEQPLRPTGGLSASHIDFTRLLNDNMYNLYLKLFN